MSRKRLEIYDDYPPDIIDKAINSWIKDRIQRLILHYKLVDNYTYEEIGEVLEEATGRYVSDRTAKRKVYKAESKLFPQLQIIYKGKKGKNK